MQVQYDTFITVYKSRLRLLSQVWPPSMSAKKSRGRCNAAHDNCELGQGTSGGLQDP